ncbi:MAG: hypothetical protein KTR20_01705 [Cellvibrionaceae bacterium]|nr:hypothetical protein [Cellvibrionaceae bacterium]
MSNQRFLFLTLFIAYTFAPTLFSWVASPEGSWLKPFMVWTLVIIGAYLLQKYDKLI